MIAAEAWMPGGEPLHAPALWGMIVGLAGVVYLVAPAALSGTGTGGLSGHDLLIGFLVLQFGALMWSVGSSAQRRVRSRAHPFVSGGIQQLATGLAFLIPAIFDGHPSNWNTRGTIALVYLAIFGGLVGYSSYIFAMEHLPVALVSIYTYINPLVAVLLGWLFYREPFGRTEAIAMVIIFIGVALVKRATPRPRAQVRVTPNSVATE
jgi:drug/metabolite transporter (DMT)-like permease